jgi:hypothetical protein
VRSRAPARGRRWRCPHRRGFSRQPPCKAPVVRSEPKCPDCGNAALCATCRPGLATALLARSERLRSMPERLFRTTLGSTTRAARRRALPRHAPQRPASGARGVGACAMRESRHSCCGAGARCPTVLGV